MINTQAPQPLLSSKSMVGHCT